MTAETRRAAAPMPVDSPSVARAPVEPGPGRRRHWLVAAGLFVLALLVLGAEARTAPFEADESDYVATSRYFGYLFLQGDVTRKEWGSNHWTRTQPPLTRYIVGAWLTAYGYDLEKMNQPYVSTASSFEVNRLKGRVPTDDVLARSRQPMVLLGAGALMLLYPLGRLLGGAGVSGMLVGLVAVGLALSSPFLRYTLVHTWAEAPLACFLLLSALLAATGARRLGIGADPVSRETSRGAGWLRWSLALGVALGLASATKLTGLVGVVLVFGAAGLLALQAWRLEDAAAARRLISWAATASAVALGLFVLVNPFLWRGPLDGLLGMVQERREEMAFQQEQWPEFAVTSVAERPWQMALGVTRVGPWGDLPPVAVPLGLGLGALGLVALRGRLGRRATEPATTMLLIWLGGYTLAIFAGLGLSYPRYFLPSVILLLPVMGTGAAWLVQAALSLVRTSGGEDRRPVSSASSG